jgi:single-strand DNA-binding protein
VSTTNLVIVQGRLGKDVELRYTGGGKAVANFSLAVDSGSGENKKTEWVNVVSWEGLATAAHSGLKKGDKTTVTGRLQTRKWQDKEGKDKFTTEVIAFSVGFPEAPSGKRTDAPKTPYAPADEDVSF